MKIQQLNQSKLKASLSSLFIISISGLLVYVCYYSLQITWDHLLQQASLEINRWVSQPISTMY
ncbi:MAG: hypothetical protein R2786_03590 [Flavobacteriaceae bacterium]